MLPPERKEYSVTGPIARASGIAYDIRRAEPYGIYDRFDYEVLVRFGGDAYDRYLVRVRDARERQDRAAGARTSPGRHPGPMPKILRPPKGEAYARIEGPKGEIRST